MYNDKMQDIFFTYDMYSSHIKQSSLINISLKEMLISEDCLICEEDSLSVEFALHEKLHICTI